MGLSCSCDFEFDGDGWFWTCNDKFTLFKHKRRKRCCSCNELISIDSECVELERFRWAKDDIEISIYGDCEDIPIASWYLCDQCGEHFLNLTYLGYCYNIGDNVMDMLDEYQKLTGFKK